MLRSLIWQLSQQSEKIPISLDDLFFSCESGQQQPSADALQEVLRLIILELPQAYVVLDALDECAQRAELMETLETIAGWRLQNLHLLVTSRRERGIESTLEEIVDDQSRICLQSVLVDKDIQRYIRQRLATDKNLQKWTKDDSVRQEIKSILRDKANGMFRWAACQLNSLAKCRNRATLRKALATLPLTLDQTYERILSAISEADSEYAIRIVGVHPYHASEPFANGSDSSEYFSSMTKSINELQDENPNTWCLCSESWASTTATWSGRAKKCRYCASKRS
ncbi:hypothetical protein BU23DRAFT_453456 [Bimuria novae-zelandiae CBS 107.79]|uniref:Nephrocystin 3-like N-terminal domain-containing protein n=1 Tax=Bimuria novae-zelandiae CBS 107.79 TaxID=1447943 RepID=A0A6A5VVN1_9PLEO|nr:hypothetical protein BU23DRAFT_453456 [Bimuria novae-zelandiae CBS 107.79]